MDLPSLIDERRHSLFGHICRLSRDTRVSQALQLSIDAFTGTPPAALTGSVRQAVHGELAFNRWKKICFNPSVPLNSQPWTLFVEIATTLSWLNAAVSE